VKRMRLSFSLLLPALAAAAAPVAAGNIFVPLAAQFSSGGATYTTKVWVSNPDQVPRRFSTAFIPHGTDGTGQLTPSDTAAVAPSGTAVLTGAAPDGQSGLLRVSGAPQLVVGARMEVTDSSGNVLGGATIPSISQDNALAAGAFLELQGLQRGAAGTVTDFSLINLDGKSAQCAVAVFGADGPALAPPATLSMLPLSRRDFADVLGILRVQTLADARLVVTCDHAFFAFALVYQPGTGLLHFVGPSPTLAGSVGPGAPAGGGGGGGGGGGQGNVTFSVPGTFLNATQNNSEQLYELPAPAGVPFKRATIEWDMRIGTFPSGLFTGVMSFRRPNSTRSLREPFCAIQIVNRNSKTLLDLGVQDVFVRTDGPWRQNTSFHLKLLYDLTVNQCELDVSQGNAVIYTIAGPAQWFDLSANDNPLIVDFGQTGIGDGAYYPPVTWSFSNLNVLLEPR
jgi:hypothetical protein